MSQTVEEFVAAARAARPDLQFDRYKVRTFGGSKAMADVIVPLILAGEKTGTFALAAEFESDPERAPRVGDWYVVTWFEGPPALLYRVTEVEVVPFEGIGERHVQVEGPSARDVKVWRDIHWPYWGGMMKQWGREPSMQMPVIFQRYEVVYPEPPLKRG
ncbi:MAG: ASCH domain-containing protein [Steroidobacteraceae bacterium]|jgi:uncharacterized protein YhfF|nr:ASCH domain-containing protein [Steroidobacteraceae bacterium]